MESNDIKKIIIGIIFLGLSIIIMLINTFVVKRTYKDPNKTVGLAAKEYYKVIYDNKENPVEFFSKYKTSGIELNVNEILVVLKYDETIDFLEKNKCDYKNGIVKIFPMEPYSKEDIDYDVEMECE